MKLLIVCCMFVSFSQLTGSEELCLYCVRLLLSQSYANKCSLCYDTETALCSPAVAQFYANIEI